MSTLRKVVAILALVAAGVVAAVEPVNINTADAVTLAEAITGVGIKKAQAIVAYRTENGPFESIDQLSEINGIGEKTIEKNRDNLTVMSSGG